MEEFNYRDLEAATNGFSLSSLIGKGSHGCVHKALLHTPTKPPISVAIKKPSLSLQLLKDTSKLQNEIQILSSLPKSPYLVNLLGLSNDSATATESTHNNNNILLVMELMPNSSLHDSLHSTRSPPPSWPSRALIALQLARALQFLHDSNPPIIHRDVKPTNILFDSNWNAKLADFGLAVRYHHHHNHHQNHHDHVHTRRHDHHRLSQPAGTIGYIDPSYTTPSKLSSKNDVYSYGVVLLEILSCRRAIDVAMKPASVVEWAVPLIQQDRVNEILDSRVVAPSGSTMKASVRTMLGIAARCVSTNHRLRPCMREIVTELQNSVVVVERVRFPSWRTILWSGFTRRRRRKKAKALVVIRCRAEEEEEEEENVLSSATRNKVSIREILADETH